jgi:sugar lactone lactonase YvrE
MAEPIVPRHEHVHERFASFVVANAALEPLVDGGRWPEGAVWFADHQMLLVSDIPNDRILRVTEDGDVSLFGPVQNPCFGGRHRSRLFLCCAGSLVALSVNRRGAQWP